MRIWNRRRMEPWGGTGYSRAPSGRGRLERIRCGNTQEVEGVEGLERGWAAGGIRPSGGDEKGMAPDEATFSQNPACLRPHQLSAALI